MKQLSIVKEYGAVAYADTKVVRFGVRHLQAACMCACMTVLLVVRSSMGVAILAMTDTTHKRTSVYDWNKETQGIILSSFFWGYTLMQIPGGILAKRFGGKTILLVALLTNGLLCAFMPLLVRLGGWIAVCAVRVTMGLTQGCLFPTTHTLLGRWLPDNERTSLGCFVFAGLQLGTIIAMPISGVLAETALGWTMIFYCMSGLSTVMAVIWWALTASTPDQHPFISEKEKIYIKNELNLRQEKGQEMATPWKSILTSVPVWAILFAHIGYGFIFMLFFTDIPPYLEQALHIDLQSSASLSALPFVAMWAVTLSAGATCEFIYTRNILSVTNARKLFNTVGAIGASGGLVILSFMGPENKVAAISVLSISVGLLAFQLSGFMMNNMDLSPQFAGIIQGLTNCASIAVGALSPVITGLLLSDDPSDVSRWRIVFLLAGCICTICNIVYVIFGTSERQHWDSFDKNQDPYFKGGKEAAFKCTEVLLLPK